MTEKKTFGTLFTIFAVALLLLPFITTFNELLTSVIMRIKLYAWIQNVIVPIQAKMITVIIRFLGVAAFPTETSVNIGRMQTIGNNMTISWNCIGWQSFILFILTLITGFQGNYTASSRIQTIIIGFTGTFLMNIFRITAVILIAYYINSVSSIIFHDYFSTLITILWLFLFWWFSFNYVLTKKSAKAK